MGTPQQRAYRRRRRDGARLRDGVGAQAKVLHGALCMTALRHIIVQVDTHYVITMEAMLAVQ